MSSLASQPRARAGARRRFWRQPLWAPLNDPEAWNRLARVVNPAWSFTEPRARVVRVVDEAPDVRSLWLKPNGRFGRFSPGQHVLLELEIDGVRQARCFSLSHAPRADGLLRLTIKRKDDGPVSSAAHALRRGQVVRLGRAQGEFRAARSRCSAAAAGRGQRHHADALAAAWHGRRRRRSRRGAAARHPLGDRRHRRARTATARGDAGRACACTCRRAPPRGASIRRRSPAWFRTGASARRCCAARTASCARSRRCTPRPAAARDCKARASVAAPRRWRPTRPRMP